jgi:hypothetical protein
MLKLFQEWGEEDKREWQRGQIQLRYIVKAFVNVTMYHQHHNNIIKKDKSKESLLKIEFN